MLAEQFTETFRDEHRRMRDMLLGLMEAFQTNDSEGIRAGIEEISVHAAPHFLYEEEALYPALVGLYGEEYVNNKLLAEHDLALEAAQKLLELAQAEEIDEDASRYGIELVRQLLPHVSERDGLSVIVEILEPETVDRIRKAQKKSKQSRTSLSALAARGKKRRTIARKPGGGTRKTVKPKAARPIAKPARKAPRKAHRRRSA